MVLISCLHWILDFYSVSSSLLLLLCQQSTWENLPLSSKTIYVCVYAYTHLSQNACQILVLVLVTFTEVSMTEVERDHGSFWPFLSCSSAFSSLCTTLLYPIVTFLFLSHARQLRLFLSFPIVLLTHALFILPFTLNNQYYFFERMFLFIVFSLIWMKIFHHTHAYRMVEKLHTKYRVSINLTLSHPMSCINVVHLLQLMTQYWYFIIN